MRSRDLNRPRCPCCPARPAPGRCTVPHLHLLERVASVDPHAAFALERNCGGFAAANYVLRALGPSMTAPELGVPLECLQAVDAAVVRGLAGRRPDARTGQPDLSAGAPRWPGFRSLVA
eukprot:PhM_4_TR14177/c6_g1_i1/m.47459